LSQGKVPKTLPNCCEKKSIQVHGLIQELGQVTGQGGFADGQIRPRPLRGASSRFL